MRDGRPRRRRVSSAPVRASTSVSVPRSTGRRSAGASAGRGLGHRAARHDVDRAPPEREGEQQHHDRPAHGPTPSRTGAPVHPLGRSSSAPTPTSVPRVKTWAGVAPSARSVPRTARRCTTENDRVVDEEHADHEREQAQRRQVQREGGGELADDVAPLARRDEAGPGGRQGSTRAAPGDSEAMRSMRLRRPASARRRWAAPTSMRTRPSSAAPVASPRRVRRGPDHDASRRGPRPGGAAGCRCRRP